VVGDGNNRWQVLTGLEGELDRLYGAPLDEFVPRRDALARRLRESGDRAASERVRKLRKPTLTAWALNQLALRERAALEKLLAAGERLREGHLQGRRGPELREAAHEARMKADALLERGLAFLTEAGHPPDAASLGELRLALRAAPGLDDEDRKSLVRARLSRPPQPAGFESLLARGAKRAPPPVSPLERQARSVAEQRRTREREEARAVETERLANAAREEARRREAEAARAQAESRRRLERVTAERDATRGALTLLEERADLLGRKASEQEATAAEADRAAAAAREAAADALRELQTVRRQLQQGERRLRELERKLEEESGR